MLSIKKVPILRYGLIVLLVSVLFSGVIYLYFHYNNAKKLQANIGKLIVARKNSDLIDSCLLNLYNADNNSRLYALTGNKKYIKLFTAQITDLNNLLARVKFADAAIPAAGTSTLKQLVTEKTAKTQRYMQLRRLTDSLIRSTSKMDSAIAYGKIKIPVKVQQTVKTVVHVDTVAQALATPIKAAAPKRKFLGRIFAAIAGKNKKQPGQAATATAIKHDTVKTTTHAGLVYTPIPQKARNYYRKLYVANNKLRTNEHDILLINSNLIISIIAELKQYKALELAYSQASKTELNGKLTDIFKEYNYLTKLTLAALLLLIIVVLYNIWKIYGNGRELVSESEKAHEYANNKSRFMASMSHEIRTPLNSVIGFSEQMSMGKLNAEQTEQINAIRHSSHMLLEVVNEILDFSKYETGKMTFEQQPFMLYETLDEVFTSVQLQALKKGLNIEKNFLFDSDLCFKGDVLRLKQVVLNLLVNAIKFTPKGGVLLQAMVMPAKHGRAVLKIRVKDSGIGIKKHDLPLIFEEFTQVNDAQKVTRHKGTGLGLAICKKIVELQGGRIKVISEYKKGSVFGFEIPFDLAIKTDLAPKKQITDAQLKQKVSGTRALLAEDNHLNVLLAKTILKKWNISVDVGFNGQEAFELFDKDSYDVVLTDIQMPVMGGLELLALVRRDPNNLRSETPVIVLTANVLKEDRDAYHYAGANDVVLKPFVERDLIEKIASHLKTKLISTATHT